MSKYKILFKITGSIAAYKSAYLVSKLVQNGFEVKVVMTQNALKFIGEATLEGLTGNQVYTDQYESGKMMSHINLMKWADLIIVCPATANIINKFAAGVGDDLMTSLFLAFDWTKPYLIAPAMNTNMFEHPSTRESLNKLKNWGVKILEPDEGYLACGDTGKGKLLEPDEIFEQIIHSLNNFRTNEERIKILITSGGTRENIDGVRFLSNLSTGKTGAAIADFFIKRNHDVTFLTARNSAIPENKCPTISYTGFAELDCNLNNILSSEKFDAVIHLAAISDYSALSMKVGSESFNLPLTEKLNSDSDTMQILFRKNKKIINEIKNYSTNKNISVIGFKLTNTSNAEIRIASVNKLFKDSLCDFIVHNDINDRINWDIQQNFSVFKKNGEVVECSSIFDLSVFIESLLLKNIHSNDLEKKI